MNEQNIAADSGNTEVDSTLDEISRNLHMNETLVLNMENNNLEQTDRIYDALVMRGFDVKKTSSGRKTQIIVTNRKYE
jgi:hypothetical protein